MKYAMVGSRTYPLESSDFAALSSGQQTQARVLGKKLVQEWVLRLLKPGDGVVSGGAKGPDSWAVEAAEAAGFPCDVIRPDWRGKGRAAGMLRNDEIVARSEAVVAFWDGRSRGTLNTIRKAHINKRPIAVIGPAGKVHRTNEVWEYVMAGHWSQKQRRDALA